MFLYITPPPFPLTWSILPDNQTPRLPRGHIWGRITYGVPGVEAHKKNQAKRQGVKSDGGDIRGVLWSHLSTNRNINRLATHAGGDDICLFDVRGPLVQRLKSWTCGHYAYQTNRQSVTSLPSTFIRILPKKRAENFSHLQNLLWE